MEECCEDTKMPGMRWRVSLSILVFFGWLIFLIVWLAFYAGNYNVYQNIAIIIVSILVFFAIMGTSWASWGMKYGHRMERRTERRTASRTARRRARRR